MVNTGRQAVYSVLAFPVAAPAVGAEGMPAWQEAGALHWGAAGMHCCSVAAELRCSCSAGAKAPKQAVVEREMMQAEVGTRGLEGVANCLTGIAGDLQRQ